MSDNHQSLQAEQTVLGYVLKERVGVGGYGEVWSCEAPGGMMKAAKFIFGFHDEKRAQRELKALDRIKHIRHPFLLSLERIDIVDGRMVVISELADMCMKVRFNQCIAEGLIGIERDELMSHIQESADALDYIAESHSLAHLDIKPENILLVCGHDKVADFGLVKDLQATNQSLMDGLTPAYAAPELFDGRPGHASDQYSLAIVYQEMLTGTRPFSGSTAAQLANQHLHSRPNLNDLPRADQAVIAKALSKQAEKRFPDCRTFVEELAKRKNRVRRKSSSAGSRLNKVDTQNVTEAGLDVQPIKPDVTMTVSESFIPAIKYEGEVDKLKAFNLDESKTEVRPTIVIGVGQTGTRILNAYRRRLTACFGSRRNTPSIRLLAMDVDRRTLFESTMGDDRGALRNSEILNIPLRKPEEYRNDQKLDVSWIGRRWIYNIPKSLLTESLRPLGRLAYVDHHEEIYRKLSDELSKAAAPENIAATAENTRLLPSTMTPQVIFVGSVAGGIGSGMLLDMAYSVRVCMGELGFGDDHLFGLFAHSTSRSGGDHRLAIANSFSFLNEMYHYNLNGYPGNDACDVPAFDDEVPVFDGTYFMHLGDDLSAREYETSIDGIAEYLFTGTVTRSKSFFDQTRTTDEFEAGMLKTMGISFVGQGELDISDVASDKLTQKMLATWLKAPANPEDDGWIATASESIFNQTILLPEPLHAHILSMIQERFGDDPIRQLLQQVQEALQDPKESNPNLIPYVDSLLTELLGEPGPDINREGPAPRKVRPKLCEMLDSRLPAVARKIEAEMSEAVTRLIDDPKSRLYGARAVADALFEHMQTREVGHQKVAEDALNSYNSTEQRLLQELEASNGKNAPPTDPQILSMAYVHQMIKDRMTNILEWYQRKLIYHTRSEFSQTITRIGEHHRTMGILHDQLGLPIDVDDMYEVDPEEKDESLYSLFVDFASQGAVQHVAELSQRLEERVLKPNDGLLSILDESGNRARRLPNQFKRESQVLVNEKLQKLRLDSMIVESKLPADTFAAWINVLVKPVTPLLYKCGGTARLLIAVPKDAPVATMANYIQNLMDIEANIVPSTFGDFVVCMEMDQMPAEHVAMTILQMQPDCAELIERLHTRNDVEWSSLTPMC